MIRNNQDSSVHISKVSSVKALSVVEASSSEGFPILAPLDLLFFLLALKYATSIFILQKDSLKSQTNMLQWGLLNYFLINKR